MTDSIKIIDFGLEDYHSTLESQKKIFHELIEAKIAGHTTTHESLLIGEHYPVITCGRNAKKENILLSENFLKSNNIRVYHIKRGGDVTYHAPGQLIMYPIIDLEAHKLGVKNYVEILEEAVIRLLSFYDIKGERIDGATGVWIGKGSRSERKICAIGVRCSRFCTMHGLALNVTTNLEGFSFINPCGFTDRGVSSMALETKLPLNMEEIKKRLSDIFLSLIFPL